MFALHSNGLVKRKRRVPAGFQSASDRRFARIADTRAAGRKLYRQVDTTVLLAKSQELRIEKWGNSLAVRILSSIARRAGFDAGQPVRVSVQDASVLVSHTGTPVLTLTQKLALFDPQRHGSEAMATERVEQRRSTRRTPSH
jgi:antitoxin MazE